MSNLAVQIEAKASDIFTKLGFEPIHVNSEGQGDGSAP